MDPNQNSVPLETSNSTPKTPPPTVPQAPQPKQSVPPDGVYPQISINLIQNPNRFYAFPLLGIIYKIIILIPVYIWLYLIAIYAAILAPINAFVVLFTGKYWSHCYKVVSGYLIRYAKITLFTQGLTDKYPGFGSKTEDYSIIIDYPPAPSRIFAIPIFGFLARIIMLIPFLIFTGILGTGTFVGLLVAAVNVLFRGKYPEAIFEFLRDLLRLSLSASMYLFGLSDKYPSFKISWNHKLTKIALILVGFLLVLFQIISSEVSGFIKN